MWDDRHMSENAPRKRSSRRMTGPERRAQLMQIGTVVFSEKGYESSSVEEIAQRAGVTKPIIYEHFGGKEGLYTAIVDRETSTLMQALEDSLAEVEADPIVLAERSILTFFRYIEANQHGFRVLVRDTPVTTSNGGWSVLLRVVTLHVEDLMFLLLRDEYEYDTRTAPTLAQMVVGLVSYTGQWWIDMEESARPSVDQLAADVLNFAWNGLSRLEEHPQILYR